MSGDGRYHGQVSNYDPAINQQVYRLCLLGLTDAEIATYLGISRQTLDKWRGQFPEFGECINEGRDRADSRVAEKLYYRAIGFTHDGKYYPPEVTAQIFWLRNRQRRTGRWTNKDIDEPKDQTPTITIYENGSPDKPTK